LRLENRLIETWITVADWLGLVGGVDGLIQDTNKVVLNTERVE
jgi:hypothetical protein